MKQRAQNITLSVFIFISMLFALSFTNVHAQDSVKVYRLYNQNGEHLYTTSETEVASLSSTPAWFNEGVAWLAPTEGTPVYRLYQPGIGKHLYTTDQNEINVLTANHGWIQDFNGAPLFYSGGSVPIYRIYNGKSNSHLLTTDANEYNTLGGNGWNQEGVAINAVSLSSEGLTAPPAPPKPSTPSSPSSGSSAEQSRTYILNTSTKKFHYPDCASVKKMAEKNKQTFTGSRNEVIAKGYSACKNCNP